MKTNMRFISATSLCSLLALFSFQISAQSIRGRVWVNNIPTPGVRIEVLDGKKVIARTGTKGFGGANPGNYSIANLPTGKKLLVKATFMLFSNQPVFQRIKLKPGKTKKVNFLLTITAPDVNSDPISNPGKYAPAGGSGLPVLTIDSPVKNQRRWNGVAKGRITGALPRDAKVVLYIKTNKVYEQGSVSVVSGQTWKVKTNPTKGVKNLIFARLLDADGVMYAQSKMIKIK